VTECEPAAIVVAGTGPMMSIWSDCKLRLQIASMSLITLVNLLRARDTLRYADKIAEALADHLALQATFAKGGAAAEPNW